MYRITRLTTLLLTSLFSFFLFNACQESIDTSARYIFSEKTITQYLSDHEEYSEYVQLLGRVQVSPVSKTTLKQLLSARGHYTVFAPTNEAIQTYLDTLCAQGIINAPSWDGFRSEADLDSIEKVIVYNSIIDGGDQVAFDVPDFPDHEHEFGLSNMNDRKLRVFYGTTDADSILINGICNVSLRNRGIMLTNGFVHQMEGVIAPANDRLGDLLREWTAADSKSGFSVMSRLIVACGLADTLNALRDEVWEKLYLSGAVEDLMKHTSFGQVGTIPEHRYYGFTIFAETDHFWEQTMGRPAAEITVESVRDYLVNSGLFGNVEGTTFDDNFHDERNVLNQFVTYHMLNQRIGREKLVIHYNELGFNYNIGNSTPTIPIMDYYQTMGIPRLLKTYESRESEGIYLNRFPLLRNGRGRFSKSHGYENDYRESGEFPQLKGTATRPDENKGVRVLTYSETGTDSRSIINGIIYPIEDLLVCTENVCNQMGSQRVRIDAGCLMPELMNNDIRAQRAYYSSGATNCRGIPYNYSYVENIETRGGTQFYYLPGYQCGWYNLQGDEYNIIGRYDFTMKLPPVPRAGLYEIRFGVATGSYVRSMAQVYFGADKGLMPAAGIPMDLRMGGLEHRFPNETKPSNVGWEEDSGDEEYDDEVTKHMRTKGFMKAPNSWSNVLGGNTSVRHSHFITRRVMVTSYMQPNRNYYIRFKSVLDEQNKEFFMDYFEYVAKEVYDNPEEPEDIW